MQQVVEKVKETLRSTTRQVRAARRPLDASNAAGTLLSDLFRHFLIYFGSGKRMMRRKVEDDDAAVSEKIVFPPPRPKITEQEQQLASKRDIIEIGGAKPRESNMESVVARRLASSEPPPEHRHLDEMKGSKATSQALQAATVYCLTTEPLGTFQISKATTLAELRRQIEHEATSRGEKRKSFAFYDLQTKQRIQNESHQRVSKLPAVIVTDRDRTLDSLLAQSTIQGDKAIKVGKNTMSFQVRCAFDSHLFVRG